LEKPLSQQFPVCLAQSSGLLGATTNNWAEQEMKAMIYSEVRLTPNLFEALMKTVDYSALTHFRNFKLAHFQVEKDKTTPRFLVSFSKKGI